MISTELALYLSNKGGEALSPTFKDAKRVARITVKCHANHIWEPRVNNLLHNKSWCPQCAGVAKLTIEKMQEIAIARGGSCLSTEYLGLRGFLQWKCANPNHPPWVATANNVKNHGSWCPSCIINVGEEISRAIFEEATGYKFRRTRTLPELQGLELDGYCIDLDVAFEYQGEQHDKQVDFFQREDGAFESQKRRDAKKANLCEQNGITLFLISYKIKHTDLRDHIRSLLIEAGFDVEPIQRTYMEICNEVRRNADSSVVQYEKAKDIVIYKGGQLLSESYVSYTSPLAIMCKQGHHFMASLESISRFDGGPRFCPVCAGNQILTEETIRQACTARGYVYLGREREQEVTSMAKNRWRLVLKCPSGHVWTPLWDNFKKDRNCGTCNQGKTAGADARRLTSAKIVQKIAGKSLTMLSSDYTNNSTICRWKCEEGHKFLSSLAALSARKTPCTICKYNSDSAKFGMQLMPQLVYGPKTTWSWQCNICGQADINANKKDVSVNNAAAKQTQEKSLLGRSKAHLCPKAPVEEPKAKSKRVIKNRSSQQRPKVITADLAAKRLMLVSPSYSGAKEKHLWKCFNGHIFDDIWPVVNRRKNPCTICVYNAEGRLYGWQLTPLLTYYGDAKWTYDCLLCGQKNIGVNDHTLMKSSNHTHDLKRGTCLGKAQAHRCPNPRGLPYSAAITLLICGAYIGFPANFVHNVVRVLSCFDPLGRLR